MGEILAFPDFDAEARKQLIEIARKIFLAAGIPEDEAARAASRLGLEFFDRYCRLRVDVPATLPFEDVCRREAAVITLEHLVAELQTR